MRFLSLLPVLLIVCLLFPATYAKAIGWQPDGAPICTEHLHQVMNDILADGDGGAFIVWADERGGTNASDIYAQRVDRFGAPLWQSGGVAVCTAADLQMFAQCVSDGAGGLIIAWQDKRNTSNYDIYAQRLDGDGTALWTTQGVTICTATQNQMYIRMIPDGAGGAVISWVDFRTGDGNIHAQRIDSSGSVMWTLNGNIYCNAAYEQSSQRMIADGIGGAILVWHDLRNSSDYDIYAQRFLINSSGTPQWTNNGIAINSMAGNQQNPEIISDGVGGAIISWEDFRNSSYFLLYAQRVNSAGTFLWTSSGEVVCGEPRGQYNVGLVSDDEGGAIFAWQEYRNSAYRLFFQRMTPMADRQWNSSGVEAYSAIQTPGDQVVISDGAGGAWLVWKNSEVDLSGDISSQHIDNNGNITWPAGGIDVCTITGLQQALYVTPDDLGGMIVAWTDGRVSANHDLYAQRLEPWLGQWGHPEPSIAGASDVPADQGGSVALSWKPSQLDVFNYQTVTHYSVWRATDAVQALPPRGTSPAFAELSEIDKEFAGPALRVEHTAAGDYYWEWIANMDAWYLPGYSYTVPTRYDSTELDPAMHFFQVITHTDDRFIFWISESDSGYSVDNLVPCPPQQLAGDRSYTPDGLQLTWAPNTESDFDCYRVYRGTSEGFTPGPGNLLAAACDTSAFDDGWDIELNYWYKVAAVDIHGNESDYAVLGPDQITGAGNPGSPRSDFLAQNYPNPFAPATRIGFGVREAGSVSIRIYDASGRLVRTLIDGPCEAGRWNAEWDGRNAGGRPVPSGVYFYRLTAGTFRDAKKMILLR